MLSEQLPQSPNVSVSTLCRLFDHTTNSYKYLFFLALLDSVSRSGFSPEADLSITDLTIDMLVLAWYPHVYFKLSFGKQDKTTRALERLTTDSISGKFNPWDKSAIRERIQQEIGAPKELARFVPYRLIRPFFPQTAGIKDQDVNLMVREMSEQYFFEQKPLYKFSPNDESIQVHAEWLSYLRTNFVLVRDWASWNYLQYMQKENPLVPSLSTKLFPPAERSSLIEQTNFWKAIAKHRPLYCIYSQEPIDFARTALDHFIPWSFVVHDELWNLIPVSPIANSSKSDRLPARRYVDAFVEAHFAAVQSAPTALNAKQADQFVVSYKHHLKLSSLEDKAVFSSAFGQLLENHLVLAETNGFEPNWTFKKIVQSYD